MSTGENQRHFLLHLVVFILTHLPRCSPCRSGSRSECEQARFVPGYNLAGEGFDIITMRHKGAYVVDMKTFITANHTCTVCENRFQGRQVQKLPASVLDWRTVTSCSRHISSALHHSADALIRSSTSSIANDWGFDLNLSGTAQGTLGGSQSEIADFARQQSSLDTATFATKDISCSYYSYRLADHPSLSPEFSKHLLRLPQQYNTINKATYRKLIDTYGTHYIRQVHLGGWIRRISAFRTCLAALRGLSMADISNCLNVELRLALGFPPANIFLVQKCNDTLRNKMTMGFIEVFMAHHIKVLGGEKHLPDFVLHQKPSSDYESWMSSLKDNPGIVSFRIFPLHHLVSNPDIKENLKRAIVDYIKENKPQPDRSRGRKCVGTAHLDSHCCPQDAARGTLQVQVHKAQGLNADFFSQTDAFVTISYGDRYQNTKTVLDDNNPEWNTLLSFGSVELGHQLILEVWDSDVFFDDKLGQCSVYPKQGTFHLICRLYEGGVFVFSYTVMCNDHLTGDMCQRYSPSVTGED